jgi:hypothetical protein
VPRTALSSVLKEKYLIEEDEAAALSGFLEPMLQATPDKRATSAAMTAHPWLEGIIVAGDEVLPADHALPPQTGHGQPASEAEVREAVAMDGDSAADALRPLEPKKASATSSSTSFDRLKKPFGPTGKSSPAPAVASPPSSTKTSPMGQAAVA